ncbi:hypothetical protein AgCh_017923 [Apium graveolens]
MQRHILVDAKVMTEKTYPAGFMGSRVSEDGPRMVLECVGGTVRPRLLLVVMGSTVKSGPGWADAVDDNLLII